MQPIINVSEEDRATDIGNMRKKFGKDRACGSGDILADRQTDRPTDGQTYSLQYFATAPAGEVINHKLQKWFSLNKFTFINSLLSSIVSYKKSTSSTSKPS